MNEDTKDEYLELLSSWKKVFYDNSTLTKLKKLQESSS